ncbi:MAG: ABC transporter ATP-binding protein [Thermoprotei archaeon]
MPELLKINNLRAYYYTLRGIVKAVDGISLALNRNEFMSIVGESGCGKSTLAHAIPRLLRPPGKIVDGDIILENENLTKMNEEKIRKVRGRKIGFVFQDPFTSLDPLVRIGDQITEVFVEHGITNKDDAKEKAMKLLEEVGMPPDRYKYYPHQLSGGQRQRAAIAIAIALNPVLLIADEPTTALDVIVQDLIMDLMQSLINKGMSIMLITHDIALAAERSNKIAIMYAGEVVELGETKKITNEPLHPYTSGLLSSVPDLWSEKEVKSIPGNPPDLIVPPSGCRFHPRCPYVMPLCKEKSPPKINVDGREVACWLYSGGKQHE